MEAMSKVDLYGKLHIELIESNLLPNNSIEPSRRHHTQVTMALLSSSWIQNKWIPDETFSSRLKRLRYEKQLTQETLAKRSGLDVGTIRQLEQGTRTKPLWQSVCALARGLDMDIIVFCGTDNWKPYEIQPVQ
jgi:DNA-binding XRE family transcriptional regulator